VEGERKGKKKGGGVGRPAPLTIPLLMNARCRVRREEKEKKRFDDVIACAPRKREGGRGPICLAAIFTIHLVGKRKRKGENNKEQ